MKIKYRDMQFVIFIIITILFSDLGILSEYDGSVVSILVSYIYPAYAPYMLLLVGSMQDLAGHSSIAWYISTLVIGGLVVFKGFRYFQVYHYDRRLGILVFLVALVIIYSCFVSVVWEHNIYATIESNRKPLLIHLLMVAMMLIGIVASSEIIRDTENKWLFYTVILIIIHGIIVSAIKIYFGPDMLTSSRGLSEVLTSEQLHIDREYGIPRITGTYLTPNGFSLYYGIIFLLPLFLRPNFKVNATYILTYIIFSIFISLITVSHSMMIFYFLTSLLLIFYRTMNSKKYIAFIFLGIGMVVIYLVKGDDILVGFFQDYESSYRYIMWSSIIGTFNFVDWIFGIGASSWPIYFEHNIGFAVSDPHSYILSIPGSYGVLGVILYIYIFYTFTMRLNSKSKRISVLFYILIVLIFIKELVTIAYLIGNSPVSMLIWVIVSASFYMLKYDNKSY